MYTIDVYSVILVCIAAISLAGLLTSGIPRCVSDSITSITYSLKHRGRVGPISRPHSMTLLF